MPATPPADWRRRAEALGSLRDASGELPAGHRRSHRAIDRARLSTERGYRQSEAIDRAVRLPAAAAAALARAAARGPACSSRPLRLGCRAAAARQAAASRHSRQPTCLRRDAPIASSAITDGGRHPATAVSFGGCSSIVCLAFVVTLSPLSYTCAALTCRPPEERAVRRSTATTRRPRSACSGASRPTSTVRAHISHHLPALRAHACVAHTTRPGAGACQVRGASAEAAMGVSSGRRRRAACCLRHRRSSHAARRR